MKPFKELSIWLILFTAIVGIMIMGGCSKNKLTPATAPDEFPCAAEGKLEKKLDPEAELTEFSCSFKKWEGSETLHFKVTVKNVSDKPQRFRVNIFLKNGKAVGGLIPRKTKGGLIKPGQTGSFVYPVKNMAVQPRAVTLIVSTLGS